MRTSLSIGLAALAMSGISFAAPPPVITKTFTPSTVQVGGVSTLTFTITNVGFTTQSNVTFNDILPVGVVFAAPGSPPSTTCNGSAQVGFGGGFDNVGLLGGILSAETSCTVSINVIGTIPGEFVNTSGVVSSTEGGNGNNATAILTVLTVTNTGVFSDAFQLGYAANLNIGDSVVNLTNAGYYGGPLGAGTTGNICANVYVFDPQEEEIGCCACLVTPNGLNSLSVKSDLISNNLTPAVPTSVVIKLVATSPALIGGASTVCNPSIAGAGVNTVTPTPNTLAPGLTAWGSTLAPSASPGTFGPIGVPFRNKILSISELTGLTSLCNFIQANGTGFGICKSCRLGALGGAKQ